MKTSIQPINGNWDVGYTLDKHKISSTFNGNDANGRPQFNTIRTEVGEAIYQLKYQHDWTQVDSLAQELATSIYPKFANVDLLIPMPASNIRAKQPVTELTNALGKLTGKTVFAGLLTKASKGKQLKDINTKDEKLEELRGSFQIIDMIKEEGPYNALLIDDLYDSGASLEAACEALRGYKKIRKLYVATFTRTK